MANIKNFGMVGVGTDVQFGKGGARLVQSEGTFAAKNATGNAFVRFQIAEGVDAGDAVTVQQLTNAVSTVANASTALQTEIDAIETGAGLNSDGTYTAPVGSAYLANATSLKDASALLDTALAAEVAARTAADSALSNAVANVAANATSMQSEIDLIETSVGLGTDGSLTLADGNYLAAANSLVQAVEILDGAIGNVSVVANLANTKADAAQADATQALSDAANAAADVALLDGRVDTLEITTVAQGNSIVALTSDLANTNANAVTLTARVDALENDSATANALAELAQDISDEANARVAADLVLSNAIVQETSDRANAVAAEANARTLADGVLTTAIAQEVSDRANAVAAEANARTLADGVLTSDLANAVAAHDALAANAIVKDGSVAMTGALNLGNNVIHNVANPVDDNDAANKLFVTTLVGTLGNAFNYVGSLPEIFATFPVTGDGSLATPYDLSDLPPEGQNAGDYYKVTEEGYYQVGANAAVLFEENDGLVFNAIGDIDKIDNQSSVVFGTAGEIEVAGSPSTGFTVSIDDAYTAARQLEVSNEANARAAADSLLSNAIVQEASDRAAADLTLSNAIVQEASDRANAVTAEANARTAADAVLTSAIAQEVSDRANAVTAEANARTTADAALTSAIANTDANAVTLTLRVDALEDEVANALGNTTALEARVDTLEANSVAFDAHFVSTDANVAALANTVANTVADIADLQAEDVLINGNVSTLTGRVDAVEIAAAALANAVANNTANIVTLQSDLLDLQDEVDAIEAGAGLNSDGTYAANATANYIANATSLADADDLIDAAIKTVADELANLSQDTIKTADSLNSVHVADNSVEFKLNVGNAAQSVGTIIAGPDADSNFQFDLSAAGEVILRAQGEPTDVDLRLAGQGAGHVIIGETGVGVIQADDGYDMTVAGGVGGGNLNLYGSTVVVGGEDTTAVAKFNSIANATAFAEVTNGTNSVEFSVDGVATNLDLVFAPKGAGNVSVSNARVMNLGNAVASTDAATLGQVASAVAASEIGHVKTLVATVTETNGTVDLGAITGTVLRVRVLVTGAFATGTITVGSAEGSANELAGAADIDEASAGIYIVETAKDYVAGTIQATVAGATPGVGSAKVYVEYLVG
jgi:hypothetical protein